MEKKQKLLPAEGRGAGWASGAGTGGGAGGGGGGGRGRVPGGARCAPAPAPALALAVLLEEAPGPVTDTSGASAAGVQLHLARETVQKLVRGQHRSRDTRGLQEESAARPPSHRPLQRQILAQAYWRGTSSQAESA